MPNAYERRKRHLQHLQREYQKERTRIAEQNRYLLMKSYEEAFFDLHSLKVTVKFMPGGFYSVGSTKVREGIFRQMIEALKAAKHEQELGVPENVD